MAYNTRDPRDNTLILTPQSTPPSPSAEGQLVRMDSTYNNGLFIMKNGEWRALTSSEDLIVSGKDIIGIGSWLLSTSANITIDKTDTNAIDIIDFLIEKPASNCNGQYAYYDFYVPKKYTYNTKIFGFYYLMDATADGGEFSWSLQNLSNSTYLVTDKSLDIGSGVLGGSSQEVQFVANTNYRLYIKVSTTSTVARTLQINTVKFSKPYGQMSF